MSFELAWQNFRRYRMRVLLFYCAFAGFAIGAMRFSRAPAIVLALLVCAAVCLVAGVISTYQLQQWRCPRCNNLWSIYGGGVFGARCTRCGLEKFSTDP